MKYEPSVIKMYAKHVTSIFNMPRTAQKVLGYILNKMNDDNEIVIASGGKRVMREKIDMAPQTLDNNLSKLTKAGILGNPYKGFYVVNPEIFSIKKKWGETLNDQRDFKAVIEYSKSGKSFKIKGEFLK